MPFEQLGLGFLIWISNPVVLFPSPSQILVSGLLAESSMIFDSSTVYLILISNRSGLQSLYQSLTHRESV